MHQSEYGRLYQAEENHWWFRALRLFLFSVLSKHQKTGLRVLDIGCGTGALLSRLSAEGYEAFGLDLSRHALDYALERENQGLIQASANELPFKSVFDLVVSVDVLELDNVDPRRMVARSIAALRPGGLGLFVMAAHQWLLSEHDRAVHSVRRYSLSQLRGLFSSHEVTVVRSTYLFFFLFPLIALRKLLNSQKKLGTAEPVSDVATPPKVINQLLFGLCWLEEKFLGRVDLPTGSSALVLVRKND